MAASRRRRTPERAAFNAALAAYLRGVIASRQIQQKDIAERFGWQQNWLSKRFSGEVPWGVQELRDLCDLLALDIKDVTDRAHDTAAAQLAAETGEARTAS